MIIYQELNKTFLDLDAYRSYCVKQYRKNQKIKNDLQNIIQWADENYISEKRIPRDSKKLAQLEVLSLYRKRFRKLPRSIGSLTQLRYIEILYNGILEELPDEIGNLKNLISLSVPDNNLTFLPKSIGNLTQLEYLNIGRNTLLHHFPEVICNLRQLKELHCYLCRITTIPQSIGNLNQLVKLNLKQNHLTKLPDSIDSLTNLEELILRDNYLTELPENIGNLTQLRKLDIYDTWLQSLPESILNLNKLEHFYPFETRIKSKKLPQYFFTSKKEWAQIFIRCVKYQEGKRLSASFLKPKQIISKIVMDLVRKGEKIEIKKRRNNM